jgi:hypothetical protein
MMEAAAALFAFLGGGFLLACITGEASPAITRLN